MTFRHIVTKSGEIKIAPAADGERILIQLDDLKSPAIEWCQTRLAISPAKAEQVIEALKDAIEFIEIEGSVG